MIKKILLLNNSVYGKTMENVRNRIDVRLVTRGKQARKLISNINCRYNIIFSEQLAAFHMTKNRRNFNKPIFVGAAILDYSKLHIFRFHYDYIKNKYPGENSTLLMTD